jgi:RNA polymerase sigma factor (sigma-70 family)
MTYRMKDTLTIYPPMTASQNEKIKETIKKERGRLFDFIKKRVANEADAEDILQDVFFQYVSNLDMVDTIERTASWLFTVAGNKVIDWYRKKKPVSLDDQRIRLPEDEEGNDLYLGLEDVLLDAEGENNDDFTKNLVWQELELALADLPSAQREVFVWHELEDKSFKEIAEITGDPVNTLISRKRYAVLFLRQRLRNVYNELIKN